ncbi:MAG: PglZ domain-containing protein [Flavobacteriales bacterium]
MDKIKILWADDEIDLLKPHVLFLTAKGYDVTAVLSGNEALEKIRNEYFDIVFLDENMPGLTGIDTLQEIKKIKKSVPVIMITKSEEEMIMENAIGSEISDYLIKPVNPNQILLSIKKNLDEKKLVSKKSVSEYLQEFRKISMRLNENMDWREWADFYKEMVYWDMQLDLAKEPSMTETLDQQKSEANRQFCKYVERNYTSWINKPQDSPLMSHNLFKQKVAPHIGKGNPVYFLLIDCLRYDQWKVLQETFSEYLMVKKEDSYYAILPTATQFARNAIFAGMMPSDIQKTFPKMWVDEDDEGGKNQFEEQFLEANIKRTNPNIKWSYTKITHLDQSKKLVDSVNNMNTNDLNVVVYNFVDSLSHARTDTKVLRELAENESAYRSLIRSWINHSPLLDFIKKISEKKATIIISTDHGTIRVKDAVKVVGSKELTTNLRYKQGQGIQYNPKEIFEITKPEEARLPKTHISARYIFAKNDDFFAYPNNFNHYVKHYKNTFQHGGISMEEMIVPCITLQTK